MRQRTTNCTTVVVATLATAINCPFPLELCHYNCRERGIGMARKRHSVEDILKLLREIELKLTAGDDVATACRSAGISDATYYN